MTRPLRGSARPSSAVPALVLGLALVLAGCGADEPSPEPEPTADATQAPAPEPEPEAPGPVVGEVTQLVIEDTSISGSGLYRDGTAPDAAPTHDEDAIDAVVAVATSWLDGHLTDLQQGGAGFAADAALTGDLDGIGIGLASPDRVVSAASYTVVVGAREQPEYVRVGVTVTRPDGGTAGATFIFLPDGDAITLLAAEPGNNTEVSEDDELDEAVEDAPIAEEEAS